MNLSFLYPRFALHPWMRIEWLKWFREYPNTRILCPACAPKPVFAFWPPKLEATGLYYTHVEMIRDIIVVRTAREITKTNALVGVCSNCNIVLWTTENLNWVLHLNSTQLQAVAYNLGVNKCCDVSSVCSPGIPGITADTAVFAMGAPALK